MISHELPTVEEELTRKTVETYEWIIERASTAQMSDSEVRVAVQTLFNATCGLIPADITEQAEIIEANTHARSEVRRVFVKPSGTAFLRWAYGENTVNVTIYKSAKDDFIGEVYTEPSPRLAMQAMDRMCAVLIKQGFKEIG